MELLKRYILPRLLQYLIVVFIGITVTFIAPRLTPLDPVITVLNQMSAFGSAFMSPESAEMVISSLRELYGLEGTLLEQYGKFWSRILRGDFGPSLSMFPTPVIDLIMNSLPWTAGLLLFSGLVSWIIGNTLGGIAGYFNHKKWSKVLETFAMSIYPIPPFIMALSLLIILGYVFPIFPMVGGFGIGLTPGFNVDFILNLLKHAFLPALSLIIINSGWWFLSMRHLTTSITSEDFVAHAEVMGIPKGKILTRYVLRNALTPQITNLGLQLGGMFSGSIIVEMVFSYPGMGFLLFTSVNAGDFNLMMGVALFSILGISTMVLLIDLLYPLIDPRVRYR